MEAKSTGYARQSYPFITADGLRSPLTDIADDLVLWIYPGTVMPILVTADITDTGRLMLKFSSRDYGFVATATDDSYTIIDSDGIIVGSIAWNHTVATAIASDIKANEHIPWEDVYVDNFACICRDKPILSSIRVNGEPSVSPVTVIGSDDSVTVECYDDGYKSVNLYDTSLDVYDKSKEPIHTIVINNVVSDYRENDHTSDDKSVTITVNGKHVWLKSEPTCDIRVCTSDDITITEISNDKL